MKLIRITKDDPRIVVSPDAITHAFMETTTQDQEGLSTSMRVDAVLELNKKCNGKLWAVVSGTRASVTYAAFCTDGAQDGFPQFNPAATLRSLQGLRLKDSSSLVIVKTVTTFDSGRTASKVHVGFAFRDRTPRLIFQDGEDLCIPPVGFRVVED